MKVKKKNLNIQKVKVFILWQRKSVPNISAFMRKPKKKKLKKNPIVFSLQPRRRSITIRSLLRRRSRTSSTRTIHRPKHTCIRVVHVTIPDHGIHVVQREHIRSLRWLQRRVRLEIILPRNLLWRSSGWIRWRGEAETRSCITGPKSHSGWTASVLLNHGTKVGSVGVEKRCRCSTWSSGSSTCWLGYTASFWTQTRVYGSGIASGGGCDSGWSGGGSCEEGLVIVVELRPLVGVSHFCVRKTRLCEIVRKKKAFAFVSSLYIYLIVFWLRLSQRKTILNQSWPLIFSLHVNFFGFVF